MHEARRHVGTMKPSRATCRHADVYRDTAPKASGQLRRVTTHKESSSESSIRMNIAAAGDHHHLPVADQRRLLDRAGDLCPPANRSAPWIDQQHLAAHAADE